MASTASFSSLHSPQVVAEEMFVSKSILGKHHFGRYLAAWLLFFIFGGITAQVNAEEIALPSSQSSEATLNEFDLPLVQLEETWDEILTAMAANDLRQVNTLVQNLESSKVSADVRGLDAYSLEFIERARRSFRQGERSEAAFYTRKALQLSPDSPNVLARALPLVRQTSSVPVAPIVSKIIRGIWHHPNVALHIFKSALYPTLLALTFGIFIAFVLLFSTKIEVLLRSISKGLPAGTRGLLAPFVLVLMLLSPLAFGPLWTLVVWSLVLYLTVPAHRWMGFMVGALVVAWGFVIPIRESLQRWLENPGIQAMIDTVSGDYHHGAPEKLKALAGQRSDDGALFYALGQSQRRNGDYEGADAAFLRAEMLLGVQPWTAAQRGLVALLQGKTKAADELMAQAETLGLTTPAHYFNWSKVKFELLDTAAAQSLLAKAVSGDTDMTRTLRRREELLGRHALLAIAEIPLPFHRVVVSALTPTMQISESFDALALKLMPGLTPPGISVVGAFVLLLFFVARQRRMRTTPLSSYANLLPAHLLRRLVVCIPGGAWVLCGRPLLSAGILSVCFLLAMPLLQWPVETEVVISIFPDFIPYYLSAFVLLCLSTCYIGAHLER